MPGTTKPLEILASRAKPKGRSAVRRWIQRLPILGDIRNWNRRYECVAIGRQREIVLPLIKQGNRSTAQLFDDSVWLSVDRSPQLPLISRCTWRTKFVGRKQKIIQGSPGAHYRRSAPLIACALRPAGVRYHIGEMLLISNRELDDILFF